MQGLKLMMSNVTTEYLPSKSHQNKTETIDAQKSIIKRDFKEKQCLKHKLG